jgi:hypothetical protein
MPLVSEGVYIDDGASKSFEFESAYYLNFQIQSALASLHHLTNYADSFEWENRCQYYHFYSDHLLYSWGQITSRFISVKKAKALYCERKECNRNNYRFTERDYPLLSSKRARNVIEHIDEYNADIIKEKHGVGGFNLIDANTEESLKKLLREMRELHPYTLDLLTNELYIRYKKEDLTINLEELKKELLSLLSRVRSFLEFVSMI